MVGLAVAVPLGDADGDPSGVAPRPQATIVGKVMMIRSAAQDSTLRVGRMAASYVDGRGNIALLDR